MLTAFLLGGLLGGGLGWLARSWLDRPERAVSGDLVAGLAADPSAHPAADAKVLPTYSRPGAQTGAQPDVPPEAERGAIASADTSAGEVAADIATAPGAVSTSSATMSTQAPVFRQQDLEAIGGLTPAIAAALRAREVRTFAALGTADPATVAEAVAAAGAAADAARCARWQALARHAAAGEWATFAAGNR